MIYHIAKRSIWEKAQKSGKYIIDSLDTDGFIHFSTKEQVVSVANFLYKGQKDMILLVVDENSTENKIIFEDLKGHGTFPHLYGLLNTSEVIKTYDFPCDSNGTFSLPRKVYDLSCNL